MRLPILVGAIVGCSLIVSSSFTTQVSAATRNRKLCVQVRAGQARCMVSVLTDNNGVEPYTAGTPRGYGPANWRTAYASPPKSITHIAIVTAYDDPALMNDLSVYARAFNLATPRQCINAQQNSCLEKMNEHGSAKFPTPHSGWSIETSLDTETIFGLCPGCRITVVEASSPSITNLTAAVDTAVASGATVVSNSYGGPEFAAETNFDSHYSAAGVTMVVSSGDNGYGTSYPAASPSVLAVGGTTLQMSASHVSSETAWSSAGSGCSSFESKPAWQNDPRCQNRTIADISADADPATGAAIYASYGSSGRGWLTLGGTSLAAPIISGLLASSGRAGMTPARLYATTAIRDIVDGINGNCRSYFCHSQVGYDGPTGRGAPRGW